MKDQASRRLLLQGILENGLYKVSSSVTPLSSLDVSSSSVSPSLLLLNYPSTMLKPSSFSIIISYCGTIN